jgi:hypothetical protein
MCRRILAGVLCAALALGAGYVAYGQSQEYIDKLKESEKYIAFLEKVQNTIKTIEKDREVKKELRIIDVTDLLTIIPDYAPPSPFVHDVEGLTYSEGAGGMALDEDEEAFESEPYGPDEFIELIRARTARDDEDRWPEEEGGFGTIEVHRGKLIVCNTPEVIKEVEAIVSDMRGNLPALISSSVYLFAADEDYLKQIRKTGSSVITPEAIGKVMADAQGGQKVELLKTGYLTAYSSQSVFMYTGTIHTYQGDTDTSGAGGLAPIQIFDPIINVFREGFIVGLRAQYNRTTGQVNLVAMVSLSKLTAIEEHIGIGGGIGEEGKGGGVMKCKVETPKVDLQIVSGSSDVPEGYGLLLGGSHMKTSQTAQKSFVVLIVPEVQK